MCLGKCKASDIMVNNLAVSISHSGGDSELKKQTIIVMSDVKNFYSKRED